MGITTAKLLKYSHSITLGKTLSLFPQPAHLFFYTKLKTKMKITQQIFNTLFLVAQLSILKQNVSACLEARQFEG